MSEDVKKHVIPATVALVVGDKEVEFKTKILSLRVSNELRNIESKHLKKAFELDEQYKWAYEPAKTEKDENGKDVVVPITNLSERLQAQTEKYLEIIILRTQKSIEKFRAVVMYDMAVSKELWDGPIDNEFWGVQDLVKIEEVVAAYQFHAGYGRT